MTGREAAAAVGVTPEALGVMTKNDQWKKGPFGSGPATRRSRSESADFRDASPSSRRHSHQRLVEFSNARPGQLAQRLLTKMDELVRTGGEAVTV